VAGWQAVNPRMATRDNLSNVFIDASKILNKDGQEIQDRRSDHLEFFIVDGRVHPLVGYKTSFLVQADCRCIG
jgi:hypothetical protein